MISRSNRIEGGLWGAIVGDALGVPVEFTTRAERALDPVTEMRGFGSHRQPPGTWSDDSSLLLCTAESIIAGGDSHDLARRFVNWLDSGYMTPHGITFDVGGATRRAIGRLRAGVDPWLAGGLEETDCGNGALMRILPAAIAASTLPDEEMFTEVFAVAALTHRHPRSHIACGLYALLVRELLAGRSPAEAYRFACAAAAGLFATTGWQVERPVFARFLSGNLAAQDPHSLSSGGYVVHTLEAATWCLLCHANYADAVLAAVNLGEDTDTTACVAGGLAGICYGLDCIPEEWRAVIVEKERLGEIIQAFASALS